MPTQQSDPHSEECERAVLGAVLLDPQLLQSVASSLQRGDFYLSTHQAIFTAMLAIAPLDILTLRVELERVGAWEGMGPEPYSYLANLDSSLPDLDHLDDYVERVRNLSVKRQLVSVAERLRLAAANGVPAQGAIDQAVADLKAAQEGVFASRQRLPELDEAIHAYVDRLEERSTAKEVTRGARTGTAIDRALAGGIFRRGALHLLAGDPEVGKTKLAMQIYSNCIDDGVPAIFLSNEQDAEEALELLLSHRLGIDTRILSSGRMPGEVWSRLVKEARMLKSRGLAPIHRRGATWAQLVQLVRREVGEKGVEVVFLDHLLIGSLLRRLPGEAGHERVSRLCDQICTDISPEGLSVAMIALTHLSRDSRKQGREPTPADVREAGEQWCYTCLMPWREKEPGRGILGARGKLILGKNKGGPAAVAPAIFDGATSRWSDDLEGGGNGRGG